MTPDEFTNSESFLDVGNGHQLYVYDWGKKDAKPPIIYLHGGPGGSCSDKAKNKFEPDKQRVIFFDQRGSGKSLPYGSLKNNTTQDSVEDIEKIAKHLKLPQFILTGGSWGASLALFFGIKYPKRVAGMVLDGIWTCRKSENDWVEKGGFKSFLPDVWEKYAQSVPKEFVSDPSSYHFKRILGSDAEAARLSGHAYENMERGALALDDRLVPDSPSEYDPSGIRIEVHYIVNRGFVPEGYIMKNTHKLTMPIWLVQGRYDMVCTPKTAYELNQKLPNSQLVWTISGHKAEHESWNISRSILLQLTSEA